MESERAKNRPSRKRLSLGFLTGTAITALPFWVMVSNKGPWQLNYLLAPGAIVALILGFITHYCGYCYAATLLGVNVIFYGSLTYALLGLPLVKRHMKIRG